jgi:hypothetical protein
VKTEIIIVKERRSPYEREVHMREKSKVKG